MLFTNKQKLTTELLVVFNNINFFVKKCKTFNKELYQVIHLPTILKYKKS